MAERLDGYDPANPNDQPFRDSLVENVRDMAGIIPAMNITGDSRLDDIARQIGMKLSVTSADELRKDDGKRAEVADAATEVLGDLEDLLGS
jgi:hypothetical protein